jgi:hypothetical protein
MYRTLAHGEAESDGMGDGMGQGMGQGMGDGEAHADRGGRFVGPRG